MNVVYFHTHDSGTRLSEKVLSSKLTHLADFAKQAIVFERAYCISPTCSPSRGALLTSTYPHSNGLMGLTHRGFSLNDPKMHLANYLKKFGYTTYLSGIQHEEGFWLPKDVAESSASRLGYDYVLTNFDVVVKDDQDYVQWDQANVSNVISMLKTMSKVNPFFISVGLFSTHREYPIVDDHKFELNDDDLRFEYSLNLVEKHVDSIIGELIEQQLLETTMVIITTDHGIADPFSKGNLNELGSNVSLIMYMPSIEGKKVTSIVSHLDIFPTICDLLSIPKPTWVRGKSLIDLANGKVDSIHDSIVQEMNFHTSYEPARSIVTKDYRYIKYFDQSWPFLNLSNIDESPKKSKLIDLKGTLIQKEMEQLYCIKDDPLCLINLSKNEENLKLLEDFRNQLKHWQTKEKDKVLSVKDFVNKYRVNRSDTIYPSIRSKKDLVG